ncbi:Hypothetical predicted protein [Drosophila guanche]|uniref:Uncharacterized protein n=1 Tax=Drosophila guanche TaxID=7266 RepID=A0A3B0K426_DROGU|nr:Hypothetical predicted protein [Drosophila guanche]
MAAYTRIQRAFLGPGGSDWAWRGCRRKKLLRAWHFLGAPVSKHQTTNQAAAGPAAWRFLCRAASSMLNWVLLLLLLLLVGFSAEEMAAYTRIQRAFLGPGGSDWA